MLKKRLKNELRAIASSVDTDLGDGDHGYLGLVLTDVEYANILPKPTPFIAPVFPGPLAIPATATGVQTVQRECMYNDQQRIYRECKNIEKALLWHLQGAIEDRYIEHLTNDDTGLIDDDIPTVLDYLLANYGKVSLEEVKEKEAEVLSITFNPADPMVTIYWPIKQLKKLAKLAKIPYSPEQLLEFGLTLIKRTSDFEKALGEWTNKPTVEKTWAKCKSHFKNVQYELKDIRGPTMQQAGYHHANLLAEQLRQDITTQNHQLMAMVQTMQTMETNPEPVQQVANAATADNVQMEILHLLRSMNQQMHSTGANNGGNLQDAPNEPNGGNPRSRNRNRCTPNDASFNCTDTSHYCWTHGGCNHDSVQCNQKAPDHQDAATFDDKKRGSTAFSPA
mmetsp:Transcript_14780/g.21115  ORF Transcript_14780/g.21115 Transcript_14780/m.21115 type:complete len:393 (+) Transcript_14780:111-1289(+)